MREDMNERMNEWDEGWMNERRDGLKDKWDEGSMNGLIRWRMDKW